MQPGFPITVDRPDMLLADEKQGVANIVVACCTHARPRVGLKVKCMYQ